MLVDDIARMGHSKRNVTAASLIVIASFAMYRWAIAPHAVSLSSARAYDSVMETLSTENKVIAAKVELRRRKLQELREQSEQLLSLLFTSDQAGEFFSDLEVISEQTGCTVHSMNLLAGEKSSYEHLGVRIRSAELNVVGSYQDITKLIGRLQRRSRKVWLDSMTLQTIDHNSDKVGCSLMLTICETMDEVGS